tara:strand:- start:161 stop:388 length:228 start_codon:yes stop_codon:yes gene_type:complete
MIAQELKNKIETHRKSWIKTAKEYNWYKKPFHIQVWIDEGDNILDSVSHKGLDKDIFILSKIDYDGWIDEIKILK